MITVDNIARCEYSDELTLAAEKFLLQILGDTRKASEVQPVAVEAAMSIINGVEFYQPNKR